MKEEAKRQFDENPRMKIKNTEEKSRHELEEKIEKKFQEVKSQIDENNSFLSALYYAGGGGAGGAALSFFLLLLLWLIWLYHTTNDIVTSSICLCGVVFKLINILIVYTSFIVSFVD